MRILDIEEIKGLHKGYFFSKSAVNFFKSRVAKQGYQNEITGDVYFTTSEQCPNSERKYTVRKLVAATGSVNTVGEFQDFDTLQDATGAAKDYATNGEEN